MSSPFSHSLRTLGADRFSGSITGILMAGVLLAAWGLWAGLARVTLYEVSNTARLEVDQQVHPIQASSSGRVVATYLTLGQEVQASQVLVELDAQSEQLQVKEGQASLAAFSAQLAVLVKEIQAEKTVERLRYDSHKRQIRAPVAGRLGEVANLRIGAFIAAGDTLGAIIPHGQLKAVAYYPPPSALGRIRPGQPARLRLTGFPWAQYGSIDAQVTQVASEVRDGRVRIDLAIRPDPASTIPLQHGLPGTIEISVDQVSPATLLLRLVGQLLARPSATAKWLEARPTQGKPVPDTPANWRQTPE